MASQSSVAVPVEYRHYSRAVTGQHASSSAGTSGVSAGEGSTSVVAGSNATLPAFPAATGHHDEKRNN